MHLFALVSIGFYTWEPLINSTLISGSRGLKSDAFAHFIAQNAGKNEDSDFNPHPRWDLIIVSLSLLLTVWGRLSNLLAVPFCNFGKKFFPGPALANMHRALFLGFESEARTARRGIHGL